MSNVYESFIDEITSSPYYRGANVLQYADGGGELYISFQSLLKFLNQYINVHYKNDKPVIEIDWKSDKPFFAYSTSVSFNLLKCYLYNTYVKNSDGTYFFDNITTFQEFTYFETDINSPIKKTETEVNINKKINELNKNSTDKVQIDNFSVYPVVGNINYIYLNVGHLCSLLAQSVEAGTTDLNTYKFLQDICRDLNKALGGINDFQVIIEDEQLVTIVDFNQKRIRGLAEIQIPDASEVTTIKAQGLGSFVNTINAQSSITPDMATTISIGAQAQGNQLGVEATSFSRLSEGLVDTIYKEKFIGNKKEQDNKLLTVKNQKIEAEKLNKIKEAYIQFIKNQVEPPGGPLGQSKNTLVFRTQEQVNLENVPTDLYRALLGQFTTTGQAAATFIPVKMDLTLSGISGVKIYQRFTISGDVLPYIYQDNYDFMILGVSHEIDNTNKWVTKLSTIIALKEQ